MPASNAVYPNNIATDADLPPQVDNVSLADAQDVNRAYNEIEAIEAELGINPSDSAVFGAYATVKTRLDAADTLAGGGTGANLSAGTNGGVVFKSGSALSVASDFIYSGGNVGIGITPSAKLDVLGAALLANNTNINPDNFANRLAAGRLFFNSGWSVVGFGGNAGTGHSWGIGSNGGAFFIGYENQVSANTMQEFLVVSGRDVKLVPVSGSVGIGITPSGSDKLHILASGGFGIKVQDSTAARVYLTSDGSNGWLLQHMAIDGRFRLFSQVIPQMEVLTALSNGNIGIGTTDQFGGGAKVIGIANATTVPSTNPTGGGVLYVESGALKYRGSAGTITTIASA